MSTVENRGPQLLVVCIVLLSISIISLALRVYTRLFIVRAFDRDDYLMVSAAISFILFVTCAITGVHYGTGRHAVDLTTADFDQAMKYWWFCYIWYCVTMITSKLSIGVFLLRITIQRVHHYILYLAMLCSVLSGLVFFFVTLLQCQPITYFWNKDQTGSCLDPNIIAALTYLYSAISMVCDFTFALLPLHIIAGLQMNVRTKYALIPILGMGCVASVAVLIRFAYIKNFEDPDFLWATVDIAIWSTTEQGLAIIAGSLASLRPLARRVGQSLGLGQSRRTASGMNNLDGMPRTIGSVDKYKSWKKNQSTKNSIGMVTLECDESQDKITNGSRTKDQARLGRDAEAGGSTKYGSYWEISAVDGHESKEEWTSHSSKETWGESLIVPRSFLAEDYHQAKKP